MRFKRTMIKKSLIIITTTELITKNKKKPFFTLSGLRDVEIPPFVSTEGWNLTGRPGRPTLGRMAISNKKKIKTTNNNHNQMVWKDYILLGIIVIIIIFKPSWGFLGGGPSDHRGGGGADSCYNFFFSPNVGLDALQPIIFIVLVIFNPIKVLHFGIDHDKYWR